MDCLSFSHKWGEKELGGISQIIKVSKHRDKTARLVIFDELEK